MKEEGHLQVFDLILETKSPVFIGCGKSYTKKEYLFDPRYHTVSFLDENTFFTYLAEHDLADAYEAYILRGTHRHLRDFLLNGCGIPQSQIDAWVRCRIDAGDALDDKFTLKEIQRFVRDGRDRIYVPGSSIKGALRTVLLKQMLMQSPPENPDPEQARRRVTKFENTYFNTLTLKRDQKQNVLINDAVNSIMRGVMISDSLPIPDSALCLTRKIDELPDERFNKLNICRECIRPGTRIRCTMTLDQSFLRGSITMESIMAAIAQVSRHYEQTVTARFPQATACMNDRTILLGGGVGFQSKTVTDPYYGDRALGTTIDVLEQYFRKHRHKVRDRELGIAPRTLKQTDYQHKSYPYGVCEVTIE